MILTYNLGQQTLTFAVLLILILAIAGRKQSERRARIILFAAVMLLGAVTLRILMKSYVNTELAYRLPAMSAVGVALKAGTGALVIAQNFVREPDDDQPIQWSMTLLILMPIWLAGIYSVIVNEVHIDCSVMLLSLLIAWFVTQRRQEALVSAREASVERRQALLLQEQMRPHFVFNALGSIRRLCLYDSEEAALAAERLAEYLRNNVDALTTDRLIPFEKELEHIEAYVALEKLAHPGNFEVIYDLAVKDFQLPALSIEPLVENALLHGVRDKQDGMVFVITEKQGDVVRVVVEDNGAGFSRGTTEAQRTRLSHGLDNVRNRLATQCGGSLSINSDKDGARLVALIPQRRAQ